MGKTSDHYAENWLLCAEGRYGNINIGGINYYNNLIDALLLKGLTRSLKKNIIIDKYAIQTAYEHIGFQEITN